MYPENCKAHVGLVHQILRACDCEGAGTFLRLPVSNLAYNCQIAKASHLLE